MKLIFIILFIIVTLVSCGSIKPEPPLYLQESRTLQEESMTNQITVPLEIDITPLLKDAEKKVPEKIKGSDYPCSGVRYEYEFYKDKFNIKASSQTIYSELYGSYWIKMNYCAGCTDIFGGDKCMSPLIPFSCGVNEIKPSVKIRLATQVGVSKNYGVIADSKIEKVDAINPCKVTIFKFDATGEVMKKVKDAVKSQIDDLDKELASISFKKDAQQFWNSLNKGIAIPQLGYIHLQPSKISLVEPSFSQNKLTTALVVNCKTFLNQSPQNKLTSQLPELNIIQKAPKDTFEIYTDVRLNYDSLSNLLSMQLANQTVDLQGRKFVFTKFEVNGTHDNQLVISVFFEGSKKGVLYLQGIPVFDNASKVFHIENLDYDIKTKSSLIKMADWLFSRKIKEELVKATTVDFSKEFTQLTKMLNEQLQRKIGDYQLKGKIHEAKVDKIITNLDYLFLRTKVKAGLKIEN